jgi:hypothetical protein
MSKKPRGRSTADIATELLWTVQRLPRMGSCSDGSPERYVLPGEVRDLLIELLALRAFWQSIRFDPNDSSTLIWRGPAAFSHARSST